MARTKNKFLNAKPVTKAGGNSNGVRNPAKPYKPPAKPAKPAKPVKPAKPASNSRTAALKNHASAKPDARINTNNFLPNSKAKGINLPNAGANAVTGSTQGPNLKGTKPGTRPLPASTASQPNALSRNLRFGRGNVAMMALGAANAADDARLTPAQRAKKYEVVNPDRGQNMLTKLQSGTLGKPSNSVKRDPNGRSSRGVNTPQGRTVATGSQQYNDYRSRQIAEERQRLKGVGKPAEPKPPAPRQQPPAASSPAAQPSASRPSQTRPSRTTATATGSQQARPAEKKPSMGREAFDRSGKGSLGPNYGIDQFGDKNGIDMERRRAFLDAKDSQEGRKAINKLMEERRKKQRENDSTSK